MIWRLIKIWIGVLVASVVGAWVVIWTAALVVVATHGNSGNGELQWVFWGTLLAPLHVLFLSALSLTLLLNGVRAVRESCLGRLLSFFLVPMSFLALMRPWEDDVMLLLPVYLPFFVFQTVAWFRFSRKMKNEAT